MHAEALAQHLCRHPAALGGRGDLFPELSWDNRPDFTGSEAPEPLQAAWVATVLAIRDLCGSVRNGSCHLINLAARPLVEQALGEPVEACAGFGAFIGAGGGRLEFGFRFRPEKWAQWIDADRAAHLTPEQDVHCWLETKTHVVDFSTGDTMGDVGHTWPPLIYWPKSKFPRHPREAREAGSILLWRHRRAIEIVSEHLAPVVPPIAWRAMEIWEQAKRAADAD